MLRLVPLVFCVILTVQAQDFTVPEATVEVFRPKGLRVSIPDVDGIKLFAFHAKINEELNGREGGTFSRDITRAKDGRWSFWDPQARLKVGDTLYYWTYVDYFDGERKLGYVNDDREFTVRDLTQLNGNGNGNHGNNGNGNNGNGKNKNQNQPPPTTTERAIRTTTTAKCTFSQTTVNGEKVCAGKLVFEDQFQKLELDADKWKTEVKIAGPPDHQFVTYVNYPENVAVRNNVLYLKPVLASQRFGDNFINEQINLGRNCTGIPGTTDCDKKAESFQILPPIFSGRVKTKDLFSFRYGTVEIRAKLPKGDWIYPELFLQPKDYNYGLHYDSGQIRVAYSPGNANMGNEVMGGVILGTAEEARTYGMARHKNTNGLWSDAFHIYSIRWTADEITVSVDGVQYGNIVPPVKGFSSLATTWKTSAGERWAEGGYIAPFDKEMFLMLGVGVGGHNFPDSLATNKPWKNTSPKSTLSFWKAKDAWFNTWGSNTAMEVDYVKVWAL